MKKCILFFTFFLLTLSMFSLNSFAISDSHSDRSEKPEAVPSSNQKVVVKGISATRPILSESRSAEFPTQELQIQNGMIAGSGEEYLENLIQITALISAGFILVFISKIGKNRIRIYNGPAKSKWDFSTR